MKISDMAQISLLGTLALAVLCPYAQEKRPESLPCISITLASSDILNCPYDQYDDVRHSKIQSALANGKDNLASSNYSGALYFFKNGLNEVKPCGSVSVFLDDTGLHEVLGRDAERRGDYHYAATSYGSILESRLNMYEYKIKTNKNSCISNMKINGIYTNNTASTSLEIKISGNKIFATAKITNNNNSPIFIFNTRMKQKTSGYGSRYSRDLAPTFVISRKYETIEYLGPKMLGATYKPEDFDQIAPHATITLDYHDIEKQYDFSYVTADYSLVHRHLEYNPASGSLTLISSNPVNFNYTAK